MHLNVPKMRMKAMTLYSEYDSDDAESSKSDQPVDLRVCSVRQRTKYEVSHDKNILASLLTRSDTNTYSHSKPEGNAKYTSHSSVENFHSHKTDYYDTPQTHYAQISISDRLRLKQGFMDRYPSHKSWDRPHSPDQNSKPSSSVHTTYDIPKDSPVTIPKNSLESKPPLGKEFVPNYRKFYSRCSNLSSSSTERPAKEFDPSYALIKERLSNSTIVPPSSTGHLYRLLQRDRPSIKRSADEEDEADRKDKTLRCLLSTSVEASPDQPFYLEKPCDFNLKNGLTLRLCGVSKPEFYPRCHETVERPHHSPYVYCPQPIRALPVLKSILVSPAPILPPSGPPSSGSPGSESTSSGSTDSGVFSDNVLDDRRRVARVLSGRHVKSGTGASLTTLRLLRQMIMQRKSRTDRKL